MPGNSGKVTATVTFNVTLNSTVTNPAGLPPFTASNCSATVAFADGTSQTFNSWAMQDIGTPPAGGAALVLNVIDQGYNAQTNATQVAGWALNFLPRPGTSQNSPISQNLMSGGSNAGNNGTFSLILAGGNGNGIIKSSGNSTKDWDWSLMVQMQYPDDTVNCFVSDPEMQMDGN